MVRYERTGKIQNKEQDGMGWMDGMLCVNVDDMICMQGPCGFNWRYAGMNAAIRGWMIV
jgi:hypothetical protein